MLTIGFNAISNYKTSSHDPNMSLIHFLNPHSRIIIQGSLLQITGQIKQRLVIQLCSNKLTNIISYKQ